MARSSAGPQELAYYEGLVFKTAAMYSPLVEEDFEDVQQLLRVKVWKALAAYDPARSKLPIERYVFSCVRNQVKDILKRKRRNELYIDDFGQLDNSRDYFEAKFLAETHDECYSDIEEEPPLVPSTLTSVERRVVCLLYAGYSTREIATQLEVRGAVVAVHVQSIRLKMSDWRPVEIAEVVAA